MAIVEVACSYFKVIEIIFILWFSRYNSEANVNNIIIFYIFANLYYSFEIYWLWLKQLLNTLIFGIICQIYNPIENNREYKIEKQY